MSRREELTWLDKKFHGLVIGLRGSTINNIRQQSGATIRIDDSDRCFVTGTEEQIERANDLILQIVSSSNSSRRDQGQRDDNTAFPRSYENDEFSWEEVDFVPEKIFGRIIGKGGSNMRSLEQKYNVKLRIDRNLNKLMIKGDFPETQEALQGIKDFMDSKQEEEKSRAAARAVGDDWETITFFKKELFGRIIGKQGATLNKLKEDYNLQIRIDRDKECVAVKGEEENKYKFKVYLCNILVNLGEKKDSVGLKKDFIVGISSGNEVTLEQSKGSPLRSLCIPGAVPSEKKYENIQGLKEVLVNLFKKLRQRIDETPGAMCEVMLHTGKMYSKEDEGTFTIDHVLCNQFGKHLVYNKLTPGDLELDKFESLPKQRETYRYDITICTPEPFAKFRYKMFLERRKDNGKLCFISTDQAGERGCEISEIRAGPGYFVSDTKRIARLDIIDPTNSYTSRLNIQYYAPSEKYNQTLRHHIEVLQEPFLDMIKITEDGEKWDVQFPKLPNGYLTSFLRRAVRTSYSFAGSKVMRTSVEHIFVNNDTPRFDSTGQEIIDVFFVDDNVDKMLEKHDWNPEEVVETLEKTLRFSDIIMQYLH